MTYIIIANPQNRIEGLRETQYSSKMISTEKTIWWSEGELHNYHYGAQHEFIELK